MLDKVNWRSNEPGRNNIYLKLRTRIGVQDDCISWLLVELRALQKRVDELEEWRAHTVTKGPKLVRPLSRLDQ